MKFAVGADLRFDAPLVIYLSMSDHVMTKPHTFTESLAADGYWPALAERYLCEGKLSETVRLCKENLAEYPCLISGRLILARALYQAGQIDSAGDEFHRVLALDPDNIVALRYLGDIKFSAGDEFAAMADYRRILEIDPHCHGLKAPLRKPDTTTTRTVKLKRSGEHHDRTAAGTLREIPFYTETMGDLYLAQGYPRLAAEVFRHLDGRSDNPRLAEKLARAEGKAREKEH